MALLRASKPCSSNPEREWLALARAAVIFGGISVVEDVDSESADELLEEGQTFEAGVVRGVEEADTNIEQEVHTHEVTQDDVPVEYDDKDRP